MQYTPFPIANFRTGFNESLEPWLLPRDAFQVLDNSHLYRGVISKINGYEIYTKMMYRTVVALTGVIDGVNKVFTLVLPSSVDNTSFMGYGVIVAGSSSEIFTYSSDTDATTLALSGSLGGTGTIDISTPSAPIVTLTFNTAPPDLTIGGVQYNSVWFAYDSIVNTGTTVGNPIMGIKPYYKSDGGQEIIVFDTRRGGKVVSITSVDIVGLNTLDYGIQQIPGQSFVNVPFVFDGVTTTFTYDLNTFILPGSFLAFLSNNTPAIYQTFTDKNGRIVDAGGTNRGYINYFTGEIGITFAAAPAATDVFNVEYCSYDDIFTGDYTNFVSTCNYKNFMFLTNNKDRIRYYEGTCFELLNTNVDATVVNSITVPITTCLHVEAYRERLELIAPKFNGVDELTTIYWSKPGEPLDFTNNEFLPATTSEAIKTYKIINSDQIVSFSNSQRVFRYTGDAFSPFRWDSTNVIWRCDSRYGSVNYDTYFSTVGRPGILGSDGVNIQRLDDVIPDFTDPFRIIDQTPAAYMNQTYIGQCYGERFDDLKEGWLCYPSIIGGGPTSDYVLAYNYLDGTYATYSFPFSCLGFGNNITSGTWGTDFRQWTAANSAWGDFELETDALVDLAGDQFGNVFQIDESFTLGPQKNGVVMGFSGITSANPAVVNSPAHGLNNGDSIILQGVVNSITGGLDINNTPYIVTFRTVNSFYINADTSVDFAYGSGGTWMTTPVIPNIITKDFNPFVEEGELVRLGYFDMLMSSDNDTKVTIEFYTDNTLTPLFNTYYQKTDIILTNTTSMSSNTQTKVWKRVYVGAVGQSHTIRIYQSFSDFTPETLDQPVNIHAIVPYFKRAGRIFN